MKKILFSAVCFLAISAGYILLAHYAGRFAETKLRKTIADLDFYADITYQKVTVNLFGPVVHVDEVVLSPVGSTEKIYIDKITISEIDDKNRIPASAHIKLKGFYSESSGTAKKLFKYLGYEEDTRLSIEVDYTYSREKRTFHLRRFRYGARQIGVLSLESHISNFDLDPKSILSIGSSFPNILIHSAEISFQNESLVERFIRAKAEEENKKTEKIIQDILAVFEKQISGTEETFSRDALRSLKEFIKNRHRLGFEFSPEKPVSLDRILEIKKLSDAVRLLKVKVKT